MGDRAHLDRCEHWVAEGIRVDQMFKHSYRMVMAHVLMDLQQDPGVFAGVDNLPRLGDRHRQRLLRENAAHPARGVIENSSDDSGLLGGRNGDIDNADLGVLEKRFDGRFDHGDVSQPGDALGGFECSRCDANDVQSRVGVGWQVAVAHDEARADDSDADCLGGGRYRLGDLGTFPKRIKHGGRGSVVVHRLTTNQRITDDASGSKFVGWPRSGTPPRVASRAWITGLEYGAH